MQLTCCDSFIHYPIDCFPPTDCFIGLIIRFVSWSLYNSGFLWFIDSVLHQFFIGTSMQVTWRFVILLEMARCNSNVSIKHVGIENQFDLVASNFFPERQNSHKRCCYKLVRHRRHIRQKGKNKKICQCQR